MEENGLISRKDRLVERDKMSKFRLPSIAEVALFQRAALDEVISLMDGKVDYRVEGDGSLPDLSITTIHPSKEYKAIISVKEGQSPVVALWVYIASSDGTNTYGEWFTKLDGEWVYTESLEDFDEDSGVYSWAV